MASQLFLEQLFQVRILARDHFLFDIFFEISDNQSRVIEKSSYVLPSSAEHYLTICAAPE